MQFTLCLLFMYNEIGYSSLVGIAVLLLSVPFNTITSIFMRKFQVQQMKFKDNRVKERCTE